jgi:hypothetical protein
MPIEKQPFIRYKVGEGKPLEEGKVITVRLSPEEYNSLMVMAKAMNISRDSTILKKLALIGQNVVINTFGLDLLSWLLDKERVVNETKLDRLEVKSKENVIQNP